jgi:dienelactone hydrolase
LSTDAIRLMDGVMEPSSWFDTVVYKPLRVARLVSLFGPFMMRCSVGKTLPRLTSFVQGIRASPPPFATDDLRVGLAGYCWGGKHAFLLAHDDESSRVRRHESQKTASQGPQPLVDCVFVAHPSFLSVPADVDPVSVPLSVAVGDIDTVLREPQARQVKQILEAKGQGRHELNIIPGGKHGFAVRPHPDDKVEVECSEKAEVQALSWFTKWLVAGE